MFETPLTLSAVCIGTWYWNRYQSNRERLTGELVPCFSYFDRYPGARTDSQSWVYFMNFSKELNVEWSWTEKYPRQPEVLEYLNYVSSNDGRNCSPRLAQAPFEALKSFSLHHKLETPADPSTRWLGSGQV